MNLEFNSLRLKNDIEIGDVLKIEDGNLYMIITDGADYEILNLKTLEVTCECWKTTDDIVESVIGDDTYRVIKSQNITIKEGR